MNTDLVEMTEDEWIEKYKPLKNPFDPDASFDGCELETSGDDLLHVKQQPNEHIWTIIDDGVWFGLENGYHYVNRLGYMLTEIPFEKGKTINVTYQHHVDVVITEFAWTCPRCDTVNTSKKWNDYPRCSKCSREFNANPLELEDIY